MGFFKRFRAGLKKTRDFVNAGFQKIAAGLGFFDEEMLDDLELLLIQSDCGIDCTERLMERIKEDIKKTGDKSTAAVRQSLAEGMLGLLKEDQALPLEEGRLNILLMVGVNGSGKTTSAGKLAHRFQAEGKRCILAAADTFRAAAIEQLQVWGERTACAVIANSQGSDPASIVYDALQAAQSRQADVLIIDTAGRLHNKQNLMEELAKIRRIVANKAPDAKLISLLTVDATTGQNALLQAEAFHQVTALDGLILTKLDGNSKGGIALAVVHESSLPIYLVGLGEGLEDLADFDGKSFVQSLLPEPS